MITEPLDLQGHLKAPPRRFNVVPLIDILFIVLFFSLLGSNFVYSPGLAIDLPRSEASDLPGLPAAAVLTVRSNEMMIFQDQILNMQTVKSALVEFMQDRGETNILIYFDRAVSVQTLFSLAELAREAGVGRVQLAFEPDSEDASPATVFQ